MPYVQVPKDLAKIKTKVAFYLTKRQLICLGIAGVTALPTYFLTREAIGNMGAMLLLKVVSILTAMVMTAGIFTGCSGADSMITVISREDGSGTRGAFTELMGIAVDDVDNTVETAEISNSTSVVIQSVAGNKNAIGYISLGSLGDEVKAVSVDGVEATVDNINNGTYKVARPFNIATSLQSLMRSLLPLYRKSVHRTAISISR